MLTFKRITADSPGFLKRQMRGLQLQAALSRVERENATLRKQGAPSTDERFLALGEQTLDALSKLVDFVVDFVETPADREQARALIEDMSESEVQSLLSNVMGGAPPLASSSKSAPDDGSQASA